MSTMKRDSMLFVMGLSSMWMVGCAGPQKPRMAPANTALGTLQRAEVKLNEGKKAQKEQNYKVALARHLEAVEMAESISTKYPKDSTTATFLKKPMIGKLWVDDVKLKTIPQLRQQSLIVEDVLGWAIVEAEALNERQRKRAYKNIFDALFYARDYENLKRFIDHVKDNVEPSTIEKWNQSIERGKLARKAFDPKGNLSKENNKVFNASKMLIDGQHKTYLEMVTKEPSESVRRKLIRAMLSHLYNHPDSAMAKDGAFIKQMVTESFWARFGQNNSTYGPMSLLNGFKSKHKPLGFKTKAAITSHLLADVSKRPASVQKIQAIYILVNTKDDIQDETKRKQLLIDNTKALLAMAKTNAKIPRSVFGQAIYTLGRRENLDTTTLALVKSLIQAKPDNQYYKNQLAYYTYLLKTTSDTKRDLKDLDAIPVLKDLTTFNSTLFVGLNKSIRQHVMFAHSFATQKDSKSLKAVRKRLEASLKSIESKLNGTFEQQKYDLRRLIIVHKTGLIAIYAMQNDAKNLARIIGELDTSKRTLTVFDENIRTLGQILASPSIKVNASTEQEILKLAKLDRYGTSMTRYFSSWINQKLAQKDVKPLENWLNQYTKTSDKLYNVNALARYYHGLDQRPSDSTVAKWLMTQLNAMNLDLHTPRMKDFVLMCQKPEAQCLGELQTFFKGKLTVLKQQHIIDSLARNGLFEVARQWTKLIDDELARAIAKLSIIRAELRENGNYAQIKPELIAIIKVIGQLPAAEQARPWRGIYRMHTNNDRCAELNELLSTRQESGISYYQAASTCARRGFNFSAKHPTAVLTMAQKVKSSYQRWVVITTFINRYGVIKTPAVQKLLLDVAAKQAPTEASSTATQSTK